MELKSDSFSYRTQLHSIHKVATLAPDEFGKFGHDVLLVANFGDGKINAFDINSGTFIDPLKNRRGEPLDFNGLWALFFLDDRLYFTAGIGDESHGLFGVIRSVDKEDEEDSHE